MERFDSVKRACIDCFNNMLIVDGVPKEGCESTLGTKLMSGWFEGYRIPFSIPPSYMEKQLIEEFDLHVSKRIEPLKQVLLATSDENLETLDNILKAVSNRESEAFIVIDSLSVT